jgi:1,2-dihydroxy-3-keto-5-methylthiopentene dioxygenase
MAILRYADSGLTIEHRHQIVEMLGLIGVRCETWGVQHLPQNLRNRNLDDADKKQVLEVFKTEIDRLKAQGGYQIVDVLTLYPETEGLDEKLAGFGRTHFHIEDEIRYCLQGSGVYHLLPPGGQHIEVEIHPGDFISTPAKMPHYFSMTAEKRFTCIRFFRNVEGYVAHPYV